MPLVPQTPVLAQGFKPMFSAETSPSSTPAAAKLWAAAYRDYVEAGGLPPPAVRAKEPAFVAALTAAFNPALAGGGPVLMLQALMVFWIGLPVPAQVGTVVAFVPVAPNLNSPQPADATPDQMANGLAQVISALTLGAVKVQVPPAAVVPIL